MAACCCWCPVGGLDLPPSPTRACLPRRDRPAAGGPGGALAAGLWRKTGGACQREKVLPTSWPGRRLTPAGQAMARPPGLHRPPGRRQRWRRPAAHRWCTRPTGAAHRPWATLRGGSLPSLSAPLASSCRTWPQARSGCSRCRAKREARSPPPCPLGASWLQAHGARVVRFFCAGPHPARGVARSAAALLNRLDSPGGRRPPGALGRFTPAGPERLAALDPDRRCQVARPHPTSVLPR